MSIALMISTPDTTIPFQSPSAIAFTVFVIVSLCLK